MAMRRGTPERSHASILDDGKRLREHTAIMLERGQQALRVEGAVVARVLLSAILRQCTKPDRVPVRQALQVQRKCANGREQRTENSHAATALTSPS
jgi:hypothetical protein